jgi:chitinase
LYCHYQSIDENIKMCSTCKDLHGSWEKTLGHHTALLPRASEDEKEAQLNVRWAVTEWIKQGAQAEKIMLGLATYGRSLTLSDPTQTEIGSPVKSAGAEGQVIFFEIIKLYTHR